MRGFAIRLSLGRRLQGVPDGVLHPADRVLQLSRGLFGLTFSNCLLVTDDFPSGLLDRPRHGLRTAVDSVFVRGLDPRVLRHTAAGYLNDGCSAPRTRTYVDVEGTNRIGIYSGPRLRRGHFSWPELMNIRRG
jgi:hypothetical protein